MTEYLPFAGTNAIQEVIVELQFKGDVPPPDITRSRAVCDGELKQDFPFLEDIHEAQVRLASTSQGPILKGSANPRLSGFRLIRNGSDGKPLRVFQLAGNQLSLHLMKYEGWAQTLQDSLHYITLILPCFSLQKNGIQAFKLRYIDRFTFDGTADKASTSLLFSDTNDFISRKCFNAGPYWHCHSGWYEILGDGSRILSQLNVGSALVENAPTVTVDHNMMYLLTETLNSMEPLFQNSAEGEGLNFKNTLDHLHQLNHTVLVNLLRSEMAQRIGLL